MDQIRSDLITALRSIPGLVSVLDDEADNIVEYREEENGDWSATLRTLDPPKLLIADEQLDWALQTTNLWRVVFRIAARPGREESPHSIWTAICNGIPNVQSNTQPFFSATINPAYLPAGLASPWSRWIIPVSESTTFSCWTALIEFRAKGETYPG